MQDITKRKQAEAKLLKSASRLELLHNIDKALLSAQSPTEIARDALTRIRQLIPSQRTSITLFDFEKNEATFLVASFDEDFNPAGQPVITLEEYGQYIIDELLKDKACRVDDVLIDPRSTDLDKALAQNGFRSWLYLPLLSQGQLIGELNFGRAAGNPFTAEEEVIAHEVANQLAIVLKQNQLHETLQIELAERKRAEEKISQSNNQLAMTNEIGRAISELSDLESVLEIILQQVKQVMPLDAFYLSLYDPQNNMDTFPLYYEGGKHWDEPPSALQPGSNSSKVISTGISILRRRTPEELELIRKNSSPLMGDHSQISATMMYAPLTTKSRVIGVVSVHSYMLNAYTDNDLRLLEGVGLQAAIAIENAQLFGKLQKELYENETLIANLETLRESAAIVASSLSPSETAEKILEQIAHVVPYDSASIQLFDGQALEIIGGHGLPTGTDIIGERFPVSDDEPSMPVLNGEAPYILHDDVQLVSSAFREPPHNYIHAWLTVPMKLKGLSSGLSLWTANRQVNLPNAMPN